MVPVSLSEVRHQEEKIKFKSSLLPPFIAMLLLYVQIKHIFNIFDYFDIYQ